MALDDLVFILGTQRSGTTWLANIFDSHPDCLHFYEPFAPAYGLFPYFPPEFLFVESNNALAARLRVDVPALVRHRSRLFDPVGASRRQFVFEAKLMGAIEWLNRRVKTSHLDFAARFNLLHLNRLGQEPVAYFAKGANVRAMAIKEVRLYFKVLLLAEAFPEARFVHVVRHPAAVLDSIVRYLSQGRLVELRDNISLFADTVRAQRRFAEYDTLMRRVRNGGLHDALALYWRITNESIQDQLRAIPERSYTLAYEDLATDPLRKVAEMLRVCGLNMAYATDDYVRRSSMSRSGRRTVLDTNRLSASYYRDWVGKTPAEILAAIERVCLDSPLMPLFAAFYE